jgi:hypothetical protein
MSEAPANPDTGVAKAIAIQLTRDFCPESLDSVEEGFDSLAAAGFKVPRSVPQHAFHIPPETWSYAQSLAVFVGGICAGAVKDVLKAQLAKTLEKFLGHPTVVNEKEAESLIHAIDKQCKALRIPQEHREKLEDDFRRLLKQGPTKPVG